MTPQEIKNSIIQLAISGKLVPHIAEEGTGEQALQAAIKSVHSCRASFSDDDVSLDLPESWTWAKLSEITTDESLNDGNWVLSKDMVPNGPVKLIQLGSIGNCKYNEKGFKYLSEAHFHELKGRQIYSGYLLINRLIGDRMLACILPQIEGILMTAVDVCWIAPNDDLFDLRYLMYALTAEDFQRKVKDLGRGTTRFRISKLNLINIAFPFPPLAEQRRIVKRIEELLPLIDRYEQTWIRLENFNKRLPRDMQMSILQLAIQGKLVVQREGEGTAEELYQQIQDEKQTLIKAGKIKKEKSLPEITADEIPFEIPESWKWVRLKELTECIGDGIHGTPEFQDDGGYYFINGNNLSNGHIVFRTDTKQVSDSEFQKYRKPLSLNTVLISINGTIGNIAFYNNEPIILGKSACYITLLGHIFREYIRVLLESKFFLDYAFREATQTTIRNVSLKAIRMLPVPLPPLAEQKRIVDRLEEILPLCDRLNRL